MEQYIGLDVSLKDTHLCVVDGFGEVVAREREATQPDLLAAAIRRLAPGVVRIVLETGGQCHWLCRELVSRGLPAEIVDARQAKAVLDCRPNKTDANDAEGLAHLARMGWYRRVAVKAVETRISRALLLASKQLVKQRRDLENLIRGVLRGFGLAVGTVSHGKFEERVWELASREPDLEPALEPLLAARRAVVEGIKALKKRIARIAKACPVCSLLMTAPGIGPMSSLAYVTAIDDPTRFRRSGTVGAYLGLTPRRKQSGEIARSGRISKFGDALARNLLYEAASVLLTRSRAFSAPKAWAMRLARRIGGRKARVALARKLAAILHRMWMDGEEFRWSAAPASA